MLCAYLDSLHSLELILINIFGDFDIKNLRDDILVSNFQSKSKVGKTLYKNFDLANAQDFYQQWKGYTAQSKTWYMEKDVPTAHWVCIKRNEAQAIVLLEYCHVPTEYKK